MRSHSIQCFRIPIPFDCVWNLNRITGLNWWNWKILTRPSASVVFTFWRRPYEKSVYHTPSWAILSIDLNFNDFGYDHHSLCDPFSDSIHNSWLNNICCCLFSFLLFFALKIFKNKSKKKRNNVDVCIIVVWIYFFFIFKRHFIIKQSPSPNQHIMCDISRKQTLMALIWCDFHHNRSFMMKLRHSLLRCSSDLFLKCV